MSNDATFSPTSRYYNVDTAERTSPDGTKVVYLKMRILPPPERFALLREHVVKKGDRPDTIAAEYLNDAEQFWRICDANAVMRPEDLVAEPGQHIRITLPEGIPGPRRA